MNNLITTLRNNQIVAWLIALSMGLIFRYVYGIAKHSISALIQNMDVISSIPESQFLVLTITFNFAVDLASSLIAAMFCGALLVYVFQERACVMCLGSVVVFLAFSSRLWRFWKYPEVGMQISSLIGPLLAGLIFISTVFLIVKLKSRITPGSTGPLRAP
jgi:hypothetical protein